jgi:hypothetical protein
MSNESENKIIVGRWFTEFWGKTCNLGIVDELAAPDMLLQYSLPGRAQQNGWRSRLQPRPRAD